MEKSSKRGKIPQSDWPLIMARYEAGETLASIARTYDCSPPAISYVVSRSRARQRDMETPATPPNGSEPQLIKATVAEAAPNGFGTAAAAPVANGHSDGGPSAQGVADESSRRMPADPPIAPRPAAIPPAALAGGRPEERPSRQVNGSDRKGMGEGNVSSASLGPRSAPATSAHPPIASAPPAAANGDQRRTLHLSLGGGPANGSPGNGSARPSDTQPAESSHSEDRASTVAPGIYPPQRDGRASNGFGEARGTAYDDPPRRGNGNGANRKDGGGSFIDHELRARVDGDIAAFLAAFDAALMQDTQESRTALREATDRLLRAGARTRIELERLEARIPLPPRDDGGRGEPAWRHR